MLRIATLSLSAIAILAGAEPVPTKAAVEELITQGQAWLVAQAQPSGAFTHGKRFALGVSQLALEALATPPFALPATEPVIARGLAFQATFKQADGGFYEVDGTPNYTTALALKIFRATATGDAETIQRAQNFLLGIQNTKEGDIANGGIGYGSKGPGHEDLSNTAFALEALRGSGVPASDARMQAALKFLERCQDLSSVNKLPWVGNSGGAVYAPDESKAGGSWNPDSGTPQEADRLAPYGSMTYALISSYLTLDLAKDDPRVQAALAWARKNYQFEANPGMPKGPDKNGKERSVQGLFYYYGTMAKTFDLLDARDFTLADGRTVDWRGDLFAAIKKNAMPAQTGVMWLNQGNGRWGEDIPHLATAYMVKALKRILTSL